MSSLDRVQRKLSVMSVPRTSSVLCSCGRTWCVWSGHSCPLLLILISQMRARTHEIPWKSGAEAPRKAPSEERGFSR